MAVGIESDMKRVVSGKSNETEISIFDQLGNKAIGTVYSVLKLKTEL